MANDAIRWLNGVAGLVGLLPRDLPRRAGVAVVLRLARRLDAGSVCFRGAFGMIAGDPHDHALLPHYARTGAWEGGLVAALADLLRDGGSFIDIGANIGLVAVPLARLPGVRVRAVEADPTLAALLRCNLQNNAPGADVQVHAIAAGGARRSATLYRCRFNRGDNRLHPAAHDLSWPTPVTVAPLDEVIDTAILPPPIVIKIDIQGGEPQALAGAPRLFAAAHAIAFEYWPHGLRLAGADPRRFLADITTGAHEATVIPDAHRPLPRPLPLTDALRAAEEYVARGGVRDAVDVLCRRHWDGHNYSAPA